MEHGLLLTLTDSLPKLLALALVPLFSDWPRGITVILGCDSAH